MKCKIQNALIHFKICLFLYLDNSPETVVLHFANGPISKHKILAIHNHSPLNHLSYNKDHVTSNALRHSYPSTNNSIRLSSFCGVQTFVHFTLLSSLPSLSSSVFSIPKKLLINFFYPQNGKKSANEHYPIGLSKNMDRRRTRPRLLRAEGE